MRIKNPFLFLVFILFIVIISGTIVFTVSADENSARVIQVSSNGQGRAYSVVFSPDGQTLFVGSSLGIHYYNSSNLQSIRFIPTDSRVRALAFSPDDKTLASGSYDPTVRLWQANDGTLIQELKGHTAWARALAFSPDGELLATASDDNTVRLWKILDGSQSRIFDQGTEGICALAFSPDGTQLATGGFDNIIRLWQVSDGTLLRELQGHTGWVRSLAFSPSGEYLASGAFDATVRLWSVSSGELLVTRHEHSSSVLGLAFSPDGELLASASVDTTVRLWKIPAMEPYDLLRGHTDFVFSVAFSPDGKSLASGAADNTVRLWNVPEDPSPDADERVSSPSDCRICHHPHSGVNPARVIETKCSTCHPDGALVLNWCPVLDRAPGGTKMEVNYSISGTEGGVPKGTQDLGLIIFSPGNGEHVYTPQEILGVLPINGKVYTEKYSNKDIEVQLAIFSGSEQIDILSSRPGADGIFSFLANIRPGGGDPFSDLDGQKFLCANCHKKGSFILPPGEVHIIVTAITPDGSQASDERFIYVDQSKNLSMQVQVVLENGQPVAGVPLKASTRLYEWREHTFTAASDLEGRASLQVEALSQNPTTYQISVPPTVVNGMLYESKNSVEVTLQPGALSAPSLTLNVQAVSGEINGYVSGLKSPIQVWAIPLPIGNAHKVTTSADGEFTFSDLQISRVLLTGDPKALAEQGLILHSESLDLSQTVSAQVDLYTELLEGVTLNGKITDESGTPLPFAWINTGLRSKQTDPVTGAYSLFGSPIFKGTVTISAPGYYSQAFPINSQNAATSTISANLVKRPETREIPWGNGTIVLPPETTGKVEGQKIIFEQGWLWGKGEAELPLVVQWGDLQITIPGGQFALERLPASSGWLYVMDGQASIQKGGTGEAIPIRAGEMSFLSQEQDPMAIAYDPVIVDALNLDGKVPIQPAWQMSLNAIVRDRLARIGIGTAQTVTFITYLIEILAILVMLLLGINWIIKKNRKDTIRE
jgi:hypothetical protein